MQRALYVELESSETLRQWLPNSNVPCINSNSFYVNLNASHVNSNIPYINVYIPHGNTNMSYVNSNDLNVNWNAFNDNMNIWLVRKSVAANVFWRLASLGAAGKWRGTQNKTQHRHEEVRWCGRQRSRIASTILVSWTLSCQHICSLIDASYHVPYHIFCIVPV